MGGKKIDLGLPSFNDMMNGKGKGFTLLPTKKIESITNGIKPINLGSTFNVNIKSSAPDRTNKKDIIGIGEGLKRSKKKVFRTNPNQIQLPKATKFQVGRLDQNVRLTAEAIRKESFEELDRLRGQGLQKEGTARGIRTSADKFAFGIQNKPIRDQSVISNREFEFFTMDSGVLQRKAFKDKSLAESQRRKFEAQGDLEFVSTVREVRI